MPHIDSRANVDDLISFVGASPSSFHAAAEGARRLREAGFTEQIETDAWDASPGGHFLVREGALMAWRVPEGASPKSGFKIVGSHTDSPGLKVKPDPTLANAGWQQVAVEIYGGPLLGAWTDRELGIAGLLVTRGGERKLVKTGPIMRVAQLAIHLNRAVNEEGLKLARQQHMQPILSVGRPDLTAMDVIADAAGLDPAEVLGHDLIAFDTQTPAVFGADDEFLASGRLDNLSSMHASLVALLATEANDDIQILAAFDHEEIGSATRTGAGGPLLEDVLVRTATAVGAAPDEVRQMLQRSTCLSVDASHAVHPNYAALHDPTHHPLLNEGPVLKINANQRYTSNAITEAMWRRVCDAAGVPTQVFVGNNDVPCGSTIGPITATRLGIQSVDVGAPLLSMHSAREMVGVDDLYFLNQALKAYWNGL